MAIEVMEKYVGVVQHKFNAETFGDIEDGGKPAREAIQACKEALEQPSVAELNDEYLHDTYVEGLSQPAQEPVGWMDSEGRFRLDFKTEIVRSIAAVNKEIPLYTNPAPSWQGLSDDELSELLVSNGETSIKYLDFARAIEQALKEKNNG
jgi:hypothetical protein